MSRSSSRAPFVEEDLPFQRKQWRVERAGWVVMTALIIGAVAGLFGGGGPLSSATASAPDGRVRVEHQRFARMLAPTSIEITVAAPASGRPLHVRINESYLGAMSVRSITPEPNSMTFADQVLVLAFERLTGASEAKVRLQVEPQKIGSVEGSVTVDSGAPLRFKQFIFP